MNKLKLLLNLFATMFKIGLFTFGGGYVMVTLIENEFVEKKKWLSQEEYYDMLAISESTPGPIAINAATYIGYKLIGLSGAIVATVAVCIPSFLIIYLISLFFDAFLSLTAVAYAFRGIQVCVIYLILTAGVRMMGAVKKKPMHMLIFSTVAVLMIAFSIFAVSFSSIFYILASAVVGLICYAVGNLFGRAGK